MKQSLLKGIRFPLKKKVAFKLNEGFQGRKLWNEPIVSFPPSGLSSAGVRQMDNNILTRVRQCMTSNMKPPTHNAKIKQVHLTFFVVFCGRHFLMLASEKQFYDVLASILLPTHSHTHIRQLYINIVFNIMFIQCNDAYSNIQKDTHTHNQFQIQLGSLYCIFS